jgi:hypothetical protein
MTDEVVAEVVDNDVSEGNTEVVSSQPSESEVKARRLGWVPKEEFKGNPEQWRDADEFLHRGEEIHGYLKADLDRLHNTLTQRDRELVEIRQTMDEFRKFHNETESRAYKRAIEELKALKISAIEQGDGSKVVEIDDQIDRLKEAQAAPKEVKSATPAQVNNDFIDWSVQNKWYGADAELTQLAEDLGEVIKKQKPNLVGKEFLDEVTNRVKKLSPEKFENPNRQTAAVGSSSDGRAPSTSGKKKSYENLPAEAKKACDKFVKEGLLTKEQYVKEFEWD